MTPWSGGITRAGCGATLRGRMRGCSTLDFIHPILPTAAREVNAVWNILHVGLGQKPPFAGTKTSVPMEARVSAGRQMWLLSHRADAPAVAIADRHYNRQKIGTPQFVPPGRCLVLLQEQALWVTSWPFGEYVKHAWPGAWINSLFRKEGPGTASEMIRDAISATRSIWEPPELGCVTFVDPKHVKPTKVRGKEIYGYCYLKAGFKHVGFTKGGLWAWQMLPEAMPEAKQIPIMTLSYVSAGRPSGETEL